MIIVSHPSSTSKPTQNWSASTKTVGFQQKLHKMLEGICTKPEQKQHPLYLGSRWFPQESMPQLQNDHHPHH